MIRQIMHTYVMMLNDDFDGLIDITDLNTVDYFEDHNSTIDHSIGIWIFPSLQLHSRSIKEYICLIIYYTKR